MERISIENMSGHEIKELIDNGTITLEKLDDTALEKVMNYEIDMICAGMGDMELIDRCARILNERNGDKDIDIVGSAIKKAKDENIVITDEESKKVPKVRMILKRIVIAVAVIVILMAGTTAVAGAFGVNFMEELYKLARMPIGTQKDIGDFTVVTTGRPKRYFTVKEFLEKEELDIMYPTKWPYGAAFYCISMRESGDIVCYYFYTTDPTTYMTIVHCNFEEAEGDRFEYNGIEYYAHEEKNYYGTNCIRAMCNYKDYMYTFNVRSMEDLMVVLESLTE